MKNYRMKVRKQGSTEEIVLSVFAPDIIEAERKIRDQYPMYSVLSAKRGDVLKTQVADFRWTVKLKKSAHDLILKEANEFENKIRKFIMGIRYHRNGIATWSGKKNNYSVNMNNKNYYRDE